MISKLHSLPKKIPLWLQVMLYALLLKFLATDVLAAGPSTRPTLLLPKNAVVKEVPVRLGDIAQIRAHHPEHEALVGVLSNIKVLTEIQPKGQVSVPGARILELVEQEGINRADIGYSIPRVVVIARAGRTVKKDEVLSALRQVVTLTDKLDVRPKDVRWDKAHVIPVGDANITVKPLGKASAGKMPLRVSVSVNERPAARFLATAIVDDWRSVPVLNKTLERGMLISDDDVEMVRLNLFSQPKDVAETADEVIGRRIKGRIRAGSTIRKNRIDIPPTIPKGKQVVVIFNNGPLRATATGVALEDGHKNAIIQVKNDASRKIVRATVVNAEQVKVTNQ